MNNQNRRIPLMVLLALAGVSLAWLAQANSPGGGDPPAQLADARAQRIDMIAELRKMNQQMAAMNELLRDIRDDARKHHAEQQRRQARD